MKDILQEAVNALVLAKGNISEAARALKLGLEYISASNLISPVLSRPVLILSNNLYL